MSITKYAFAFNRNDYKDHIWGFVFGAVGEYYKAEIAKLNNYPTFIFYWENEVGRLIDSQLPGWVEIAGTKGTFDRWIAILEAVATVQTQSHRKWNRAQNEIIKQLNITPRQLKLPNKEDSDATFFNRALENAKAVLEEEENN